MTVAEMDCDLLRLNLVIRHATISIFCFLSWSY